MVENFDAYYQVLSKFEDPEEIDMQQTKGHHYAFTFSKATVLSFNEICATL